MGCGTMYFSISKKAKALPKGGFLPIGRPSWLSPYAQVWREELEGEPPWGQMAKFLAPLEKKFGAAEVANALRRYLREAGVYVSVARFSQTFGLWRERRATHRPAPEKRTKFVAIQEGARQRLIEVPLDDPRPGVE